MMVVGAKGMLGTELCLQAPDGADVWAVDLPELDIGDRQATVEAMRQFGPEIVVNAAAYTDVDKSETERDLAMRVNGLGTLHLASAAREVGARLVHVSTDFVFDGRKGEPYEECDAPNPLGVYGKSKYYGEKMERWHPK